MRGMRRIGHIGLIGLIMLIGVRAIAWTGVQTDGEKVWLSGTFDLQTNAVIFGGVSRTNWPTGGGTTNASEINVTLQPTNYTGVGNVESHLTGVDRVLGYGPLLKSALGVEMGYEADYGDGTGVAIGWGAESGDSAVALGVGASSVGWGTAVGNNANGTNYGVAVGLSTYGQNYGVAGGTRSKSQNYGVAIGSSHQDAFFTEGTNYGIAVGSQTLGSRFGVAVGTAARGHDYGVAIGCTDSQLVWNSVGTKGTNYGVAIGNRASGSDYGVAIGAMSAAASNSVVIGSNITNTEPNSTKIKGNLNMAGAAITGAANIEAQSVTLPNSGPGLVPAGCIMQWPGTNNIPVGWMVCDGRAITNSAYPALYEALGPVWQSSTYVRKLPNLQSRVVVGAGQGSDLSLRTVGEIDGEEQVTLTIAQMPAHAHNHRGAVNNLAAGSDYKYPAAASWDPDIWTSSRGSNSPHENMPPFIVLNYIIKY
ncbi:MAG: tail fiber protein [Dehalococcoidia bacterium]